MKPPRGGDTTGNAGGPWPGDQEPPARRKPLEEPRSPQRPHHRGVPGPPQAVRESPAAPELHFPACLGRRRGEGGKAGTLPGWRLAAASAVCLLPAAPVRECQAEEGTRRSLAAAPPAPPSRSRAAGEAASERASERAREGGREEPGPGARSGGPHERAVSGESAAAGASRRGGTQPWTGSWGEWGPPLFPRGPAPASAGFPAPGQPGAAKEAAGGPAGRPAVCG